MKLNPIKIQVKDNRRFGEVAFLVDMDSFLQDIEKVRKRLGIDDITDRESAKDKWGIKYGLFKNLSKLDVETLKLLKKYKKSWQFFSVIKFSIISGHVADEDYGGSVILPKEILLSGRVPNKSCWYVLPVASEYDGYDKLAKQIKSDGKIQLDTFEAAIVINPSTKIEDVQQCFRQFQERIDKEFPNWRQKDVISNIKRDRKWYWMKKKDGLSYDKAYRQNQIWDKERIGFEGFKKAIQQYQRRLNG